MEAVIDGRFRIAGLSLRPGTDEEPPENISFSELVPRLAVMLNSAFSVIHTTEAPRHWESRFSERPSIVDANHLQEMWALSESRGINRQPWMRMKQRFQEIAPNSQTPVGVRSTIDVEEGDITIRDDW